MHGSKQSRPRRAGLPAEDGPGTYRDQPGDAQDQPGGDPDNAPPYQTCAVPASPRGDYPAEAGSGGRPTSPHGSRSRGDRRRRRRQVRAARRTIAGRHPVAAGALAVIVLLTPVWVSLGNALANPGLGTSVAARGAEWFRGHGGSGIVNWAENLWYSHHPPPTGGVIILADKMLPPRKHGLLIPGPQAHAMKLGFEKYFLWKARHGYVQLP